MRTSADVQAETRQVTYALLYNAASYSGSSPMPLCVTRAFKLHASSSNPYMATRHGGCASLTSSPRTSPRRHARCTLRLQVAIVTESMATGGHWWGAPLAHSEDAVALQGAGKEAVIGPKREFWTIRFSEQPHRICMVDRFAEIF